MVSERMGEDRGQGREEVGKEGYKPGKKDTGMASRESSGITAIITTAAIMELSKLSISLIF